jgi:hypothetical protein
MPSAPREPIWKRYPYVTGFLFGALFLTVQPILQRQFLKAPPPIRELNAWEVPSLGGGPVSSAALSGKVVIATSELGPCDDGCLERQKTFGLAVRHVDDLKDKVILVTLVGEEAKAGLSALIGSATPVWRFAGGTDTQLGPFLSQLQLGLDQFFASSAASSTPPSANFGKAHVIVLLDQNGAVRGYWRDDGEGRGNSITAARLLAKAGPNP